MQTIRLFTIAAMIILLLLLVLAGSVYYQTEMKLTPVITANSPSGAQKLDIYMVGEPAWPFGPTDCRFELYSYSEKVVRYPFSIHNDGAPAFESNFIITWYSDHAEVLVRAEEQFAVTYILYFDGNVGAHQEDYQ